MKSSKVKENLKVFDPKKLRKIKENINFRQFIVSKVGDQLSLLLNLNIASGLRLKTLQTRSPPDPIFVGI